MYSYFPHFIYSTFSTTWEKYVPDRGLHAEWVGWVLGVGVNIHITVERSILNILFTQQKIKIPYYYRTIECAGDATPIQHYPRTRNYCISSILNEILSRLLIWLSIETLYSLQSICDQ
jgi:hypothetical protein